MLVRLRNLIASSFAVVFSLLAFPSLTPTVLIVWVGVSWFARFNRVNATAAILFSTALLLLREPTNPCAIAYSIVAVIVALIVATSQTTSANSLRLRNAGLCCLAIAGLTYCVERRFATIASSAKVARLGDQERVGGIVCLGDSLTSGLPSIGGYPPLLQELTEQSVHDFGREGITISEASPLVTEFLALQPSIVVIELGGHDFLKKHSREDTKNALKQLIEVCEASEARVVLCEIPRGFILDPFFGLEREIAREMDLDLIPDSMIRRLVLFSPFAPPGIWLPKDWRYSDDGLHPNDRGNRMLAKTVAGYL